jgi:2-amino-4-hydroxy-6-hydroxymethyldihydropteridine diphosphokinase
MSLVYLILGGNRGNREEIFLSAIHRINNTIGQIFSSSTIYESESWGFKSEPFINQVIALETNLTPEDILDHCQEIESSLGRTRKGGGYEARTIDIDILYIGSLVINTERLKIPHPRIAERRFVLIPLAEIEPDLRDPSSGLTVSEMLLRCKDQSKVWKLAEKNPEN